MPHAQTRWKIMPQAQTLWKMRGVRWGAVRLGVCLEDDATRTHTFEDHATCTKAFDYGGGGGLRSVGCAWKMMRDDAFPEATRGSWPYY